MHCLYNYWFCYENAKKKKNYLEVYLEECEYRMKKTKIPKFIDAELKSESELESGTELESKSEWKFGTE